MRCDQSVTPRRVLTWTFGLRTPFNPMSDAAAEATRLAPAGRACSKFIWQSRFLKNWAVRMPAFGRPAFLTITNVHARITNHRRLWQCALLWRFVLRASNSGAPQTWSRRTPAAESMRISSFTTPVRPPTPRLATLLPRLGVTPRGRNAADGGGQRRITVGALTRWPFDGLAGPEFVSEFETKRDQ